MSSPDTLRQQFAVTKLSEQRLRQELRQLVKATHPKAALASVARNRCNATMDVALRILVISGPNEAAALQYVVTKLKDKQPISSLISSKLLQRFQDLSESEKTDLLKTKEPVSQRRLVEAQRFLQQLSLQGWLRAQNEEKALAPTGVQVYQQWQHLQQSRSRAQDHAAASTDCTPRARMQWVRRWSRRFGIVRGNFKAGSRLPLPVARDKVIRQTLLQSKSL